MRLAYMSMDRPEMLFAGKELARGMSRPLERHWAQLKRAVRFTLADSRSVWVYRRQRDYGVVR
eukprot:645381-Amphidinium_carterae.1